jgi:pimeloyl-ACP methyl ester carboxylesterase
MTAVARQPGFVRADFSIASSAAPWLALHLHAVAPQEPVARAVLLLHGATLPSFIFDMRLPGCSVQERLAAAGWATYALDARGFGRSSRPTPGEAGCPEDVPFGRAHEAAADVVDALRYLRDARGHAQLALMGFSWGTILAACVAARHAELIDRLVLCAPIHACHNEAWLQRLRDPHDPSRLSTQFGAYRWTAGEALQARWDGDIPIADKSAWRDPAVLEAVLAAALASDPLSHTRKPPGFRAPAGPADDLMHAFSGRSLFDAARIRTPVLLVRGEGDTTATDEDARGLLDRLASDEKQYSIVAAGSHFQCLERSMPALLAACTRFLSSAR